jgi:hypothetical protein
MDAPHAAHSRNRNGLRPKALLLLFGEPANVSVKRFFV